MTISSASSFLFVAVNNLTFIKINITEKHLIAIRFFPTTSFIRGCVWRAKKNGKDGDEGKKDFYKVLKCSFYSAYVSRKVNPPMFSLRCYSGCTESWERKEKPPAPKNERKMKKE